MKEYSAVYRRKQLIVAAKDINEALIVAASYFGCKDMESANKIELTLTYDYDSVSN